MPRHPERPTIAFLLADPRPGQPDAEVRASLGELARLLGGLGIEVAETLVPRRSAPSRAVLGEGKREEVRARLEALACELVVVDGALEPGQQRELERALGAPVLDRTGVVLRVFERRARTRLAKVEIELARLAYDAPRIRDEHASDDRQGGGGRGGRGHTNVELEKQAMRKRAAKLERELASLREIRAAQSAERRELPRVALVGYTNAGKSSLLRALTGSEVTIEDALFATLDPTVRALSPGASSRILVSDTVGFLRNLPHSLVASFRSTLDEARDADLLLLVVDASDPSWREQLAVTRETLEAIGATAPAWLVLNKVDRVEERAGLERELPDAIAMSAHEPADVARLRGSIVAFFERNHEEDMLVVPYAQPALLAEIRGRARVTAERWNEGGAVLAVRAPKEAIAGWREALPARAIDTPAELLAAARAYGLSLTSERADFDDSGLDFRVVHAEDEHGAPWIVRSPRRPDVVEGAQREARALRLVRDALPVAVPDWHLHARDVIAYPRLPGTPGWSLGADGAVEWALDATSLPEAFLESLAQTVAALQAVPLARVRDAGVRIETPEEARADIARAMSDTRGVLSVPEPVWARWQRWLEDDSMWPPRTALVHGDLHPGHLILDEERRVTGVLDWTEARVSDPSIDLVLFAGCFGRLALEAFARRLERAGGASWPRLVEHTLERWGAYPALVAAWALKTGSEAGLEHARHHLATVTAAEG